MLVLTRKPGEIIDIGDDIEVEVLGVHYDQVKLGINAPAHVKIHRREITLRILASKPNEHVPWPQRIKDSIRKLLSYET